MTTELEKKEALEEICNLVREAEAAINKAEVIANKYGVGFNLDLGGYGMGGYYRPESEEKEDWESSDSDDYGWQSSSQSC